MRIHTSLRCAWLRFAMAAVWVTSSCTKEESTANAPLALAQPPTLAAAHSPASSAGIPAALLAAREAVWKAYFTGDSVALIALLPEPMIGMDESRAEIIANARTFAKGTAKYEGIVFADEEFVLSDSVAVTFARYTVTLRERDQPKTLTGRAIEVFRFRDGRWTNPSWHLHDVP